ncbi:spermidine/putrescine ABC transporter substrate-binding protein [Microbacterium sp. MYb62]|uniref:polyamine ABC transporter substrate-binding protein n=1 Tax=Microbacterium sp. MYb62 TaxID=1848690 RepID=UPI000CFC50A5|nr:spermidine/putrescine ABC transporter substrate-binding protein [Microbacterium sp. MYb62]PRB16474.1 spermidine/putrescine ABC transporter substrate-binding protein [Microbacterium sp. MYb62]
MRGTPPVRVLAHRSAARVIRTELTRRGFLATAIMAGGAVVLSACTPGQNAAAVHAKGGPLEDKLSIYSWGDYDAPEVLEQFTAESGPRIVLDAFNSNEELIAKLVAARGTSGYDIVVPTGVFVGPMAENGLLQKFNLDLLPNMKHVAPEFRGRSWDPGNEYSVCKAWGTTGFVYDKRVISRELTTWNDFIDAAQNEASGSTSVLDDPAPLLGIYFWANGIDWTTTDPDDLDAVEKFLVEDLAPHVSAFDSYPGGSSIPQASHALLQSYNGDARLGIFESDDPDRWQWVLGSPATELWMDNWAIAAGAPHPEAAHAFIDFVLQPDVQLAQVDYIGYDTGISGIRDEAEAAGLERLDMVFFDEEQVATMHEGKLTEAQDRVVSIWNSMKAAAGA